jgi:hypothetical protein
MDQLTELLNSSHGKTLLITKYNYYKLIYKYKYKLQIAVLWAASKKQLKYIVELLLDGQTNNEIGR